MNKKYTLAKRRAQRVRSRIRKNILNAARLGTIRYRLSMHVSNRYIYAQVIDDLDSNTVASCSSIDATLANKLSKNAQSAAELGEKLGSILVEKNIKNLVFDKGANMYGKRFDSFLAGIRAKEISV